MRSPGGRGSPGPAALPAATPLLHSARPAPSHPRCPGDRPEVTAAAPAGLVCLVSRGTWCSHQAASGHRAQGSWRGVPTPVGSNIMTVGYLYSFFFFFSSLFPDQKVKYQAAQDKTGLATVSKPSSPMPASQRAWGPHSSPGLWWGVATKRGTFGEVGGSGQSETDPPGEGMGTGNSHP